MELLTFLGSLHQALPWLVARSGEMAGFKKSDPNPAFVSLRFTFDVHYGLAPRSARQHAARSRTDGARSSHVRNSVLDKLGQGKDDEKAGIDLMTIARLGRN
jgi:hypothetical protein